MEIDNEMRELNYSKILDEFTRIYLINTERGFGFATSYIKHFHDIWINKSKTGEKEAKEAYNYILFVMGKFDSDDGFCKNRYLSNHNKSKCKDCYDGKRRIFAGHELSKYKALYEKSPKATKEFLNFIKVVITPAYESFNLFDIKTF